MKTTEKQTTMRVSVTPVRPESYPVTIGAGLLAKLPTLVPALTQASCAVVITDTTTKRLFGTAVVAALNKAGCPMLLVTLPAGEQSKAQRHKTRLEEQMLKHHCDRRSVVVALGGGVVGDVAGFVAATYLRGIPYVQVPTTLLAMVDSSIGGKTGLNTVQGKNVIGSIWPPIAVVVDTDVLRKLPRRYFVNGLVEALKMFITSDAASFAFFQKNAGRILARDEAAVREVIKRGLRVKAGVVSRDERERGERMVLNCGHTIGHALEQLSGYTLLHGHAVALGMQVELDISRRLGILSAQDYTSIVAAVRSLGMSTAPLSRWSVKQIIKQTLTDKKSHAGRARYVLVATIGAVRVRDKNYAHSVDDTVVAQALAALQS